MGFFVGVLTQSSVEQEGKIDVTLVYFFIIYFICAGCISNIANLVFSGAGLCFSASIATFCSSPIIFFWLAIVPAFVGLLRLLIFMRRSESQIIRNFLVYVFMVSFCYFTVSLPHLWTGFPGARALLLFGGLLALINAPFDWISLTLTRWLLRRGLDLGGWWPLALALGDVSLSVGIISLLALSMLIGVQAYNEIASLGGNSEVLAIDLLLIRIAVDPSAPENYWIYFTLLTTMIPSVLNLAIAGFSLARGVPGVSQYMLARMPSGHPVPGIHRGWIALILTTQKAIGVFLAIFVQGLAAYLLLFVVPPLIGPNLLQLSLYVVHLDVPSLVGHIFFGGG
jgi:hypothetical protein